MKHLFLLSSFILACLGASTQSFTFNDNRFIYEPAHINKNTQSELKPHTRNVYYPNENNIELWVLDSKVEISYNQQGLKSTEIYKNADGSFRGKKIFLYDMVGRNIETLQQIYSNGEWINDQKLCNYFYTNGHDSIKNMALQWIGSNWDTISGLKLTYTYDQYGNKTSETTLQPVASGWENFQKTAFIFNSNQEMIEQITLISSLEPGQDWDSIEKLANIYNNDGAIVEVQRSLWEPSTGTWEYDQRLINIEWYNQNQDPLSHLSQVYENEVWIDYARYMYNYDENGGYTSTVESYTGSSWINNMRYSVSYNSLLHYTGTKYELWENSDWVLFNGNEQIYSYGDSNIIESIIYRRKEGWTGNTPMQNVKKEVFENFHPVTIFENPKQNYTIYPNPVKNEFVLTTNENTNGIDIKIIDIWGNTVKCTTLVRDESKVTIDTDNWATGIYYIIIMGKKEIQSSTLIKY